MSSTKPLALIIEDHEDQNFIFTTALKQAGFSTESILEGATAQKRLTEVVPKLIVLDLHIPEIHGEEILRQIRGDHRLDNTRVILATADASLAENLQAQVDFVMLKPVSFTQLSQLSKRLL